MQIPKLMQLAIDNAKTSKPMRAENVGDEATIYLHGVIGGWWGDIDETAFAKTMAGIDAKTIHLRINSPGGDVFAARAMMTAIRQHPANVIAHVDGMAASAATDICMAANSVEISKGAFFMIHNAWTVAIGNKDEMRTTANLLEKIDGAINDDYVARTGKTADEVKAWMDAETWFTADEAVANGFADAVVEVSGKASNSAAAWNVSAYKNAPKALTEPKNPAVDDASVAAHRAHLERGFSMLERTPA
jgi:ATP-dependent Clp protease protease subunit